MSTPPSINEEELLELKTKSRKHILYGLILISILPCFLFLLFYTILGSFVLFIIITPSLGLWFLYDGITGYKKYRHLKKQTQPPDLFA
jgi:hypothetical protein